jgi:hypothetical protein
VSFTLQGGGDYHLTASSPARNSGTNLCAPNSQSCVPTIDFDGISRPKDSFYDIGAYEYTSSMLALAATLPSTPCDLNADGSTDVVDAQLLENAILSKSDATIYDINRDGQLNLLDVQALQNVILGKIPCP